MNNVLQISANGTLLSNKKIGLIIDLGYPEAFDDAAKLGIPLATLRVASNYGDEYVINTTGKVTSSVLEAEIQGKTLVDKAPFPFQWKTETKYDFKPSELFFVSKIFINSITLCANGVTSFFAYR